MPGPDAEEVDHELGKIIQHCPKFYSAYFQRGEYMLRIGSTEHGEKLMDRAFELMADILIEEEKEFEQELYHRIENLEKLLRCDLAAKYMEKTTRLFPETAEYYDDLTFYILQQPEGNKGQAMRMQEKALEIDPDNDNFINNLGWVHLMMGNYRDAEESFQKALEFNIDNPGALKNADTAEYMHKHKLNYFEYLVRPADMEEIDTHMQNVDFEEVARLCGEYNADRLDAFKFLCLQKKTLPPHEILDVLQPLNAFLNLSARLIDEQVFLYEKIDLLYDNFEFILYQFIIAGEFIEVPMLEHTAHSLSLFYDFLNEVKLAPQTQRRRFIEHIRSVTGDFSRKIDEYNRLRHDIELPEKEKEEAIAELFGMQYAREEKEEQWET